MCNWKRSQVQLTRLHKISNQNTETAFQEGINELRKEVKKTQSKIILGRIVYTGFSSVHTELQQKQNNKKHPTVQRKNTLEIFKLLSSPSVTDYYRWSVL